MKKCSDTFAVKQADTTEAGLPEGWVISSLGAICEQPQYGWTTSAKRSSGGIRLLRTTDISGGNIDWSAVPFCDEDPDNPDKYLLRKGDIIVSRAGSVGISYLIDECPPAVFASYLIRLRVIPPVLPEFVRLFLLSPDYWSAIAEGASGIAVQNINGSKLKDLRIPLPPLAEQKRIVAKVEELLARVNAAREHLAKVPAILKRFRQSVLYVACSEGAETRLGDLLLDIKYGTAQKCTFEPKGTPVLRIPNIADKGVDHDNLKYCVLEDAEIRRLALQNGDLLMIRSNGSVELLGRTTLVTEGEKGFAYAGYLMRLRADTTRVMPAYLNLCLRSQECRDQIEMPARSTSGVNNINSQEVRNLAVMIPSLPVQHEIIRRVDALFALADSIEKQAAAGTARVEKLTQAILAKAFRGELVPQDPNEEPASILLDRISNVSETKMNEPKGKY